MSLLLLLILAACGTGPPTQAPAPSTSTGPDALRPDLLLLMGDRITTTGGEGRAFLEAFPGAAPGYPAAYAQSPSTWVSLGSLLTGLAASAIPLCDGSSGRDAWCTPIPAARTTLPEILSLYGYRTALFTAGTVFLDPLGDRFQAAETGVDPEVLPGRVAAWWSADPAAPRLLVVILGREASAPSSSPWRLHGNVLAWAWRRWVHRAGRRVHDSAQDLGGALAALEADLPSPALDRARWVATGSLTGAPSTGAKATGGTSRGYWLLDAEIHVPLALIGPEPSPPLEAPVTLMDILPTFVGLAGGVVPTGLWGTDLLRTGAQRVAYAEFGDMLALRSGRLLLVFRAFVHSGNTLDPSVDHVLEAPDALTNRGRWLLHDVVRDPLQRHNLVGEHHGTLSLYRTLCQERRRAREIRGAIETEDLWQLRMSAREGYW